MLCLFTVFYCASLQPVTKLRFMYVHNILHPTQEDACANKLKINSKYLCVYRNSETAPDVFGKEPQLRSANENQHSCG